MRFLQLLIVVTVAAGIFGLARSLPPATAGAMVGWLFGVVTFAAGGFLAGLLLIYAFRRSQPNHGSHQPQAGPVVFMTGQEPRQLPPPLPDYDFQGERPVTVVGVGREEEDEA